MTLLLQGAGGSGAKPFSPKDIQSAPLKQWLRADAGVFQDAAMTTPADNGNPVGGWQDGSGLNHHVTQSSAPNRPTLKTNQRNGLPGVLFTAASETIMQGLFTLPQPVARYFVFTQPLVNSGKVLADGGLLDTAYLYAGTHQLLLYGGVDESGLTTMDLSWHIVWEYFNGVSSVIACDGGASATLNGGTAAQGGLTLGGRASASFFSDVQYGEVLLYGGIPSADDHALILKYLRSRWNPNFVPQFSSASYGHHVSFETGVLASNTLDVAATLITTDDAPTAAPTSIGLLTTTPAGASANTITGDVFAPGTFDTDPCWNQTIFDSNQKIVEVGMGTGFAPDPNFYGHISRYHLDGTLDTSFNGTGRVEWSSLVAPNNGVRAVCVCEDADGNYLVAGYIFIVGGDNVGFVRRYSSAGVLDTGFGTSGETRLPHTNGNADQILALAIDGAGLIYTRGYTDANANTEIFSRLLANGTLDTSYGTAGQFSPTITSQRDRMHSMLVDNAGNVYVPCSTVVSQFANAAICSYDPTGAVNWTRTFNFGTDNEAIFRIIFDTGTIVGVGWMHLNLATFKGVMIRCFQNNGTPDTSAWQGVFDGTGGQTLVDFNTTDDELFSVTVSTDQSKYVCAGWKNGGASLVLTHVPRPFISSF